MWLTSFCIMEGNIPWQAGCNLIKAQEDYLCCLNNHSIINGSL
jgi:hypothetical protein